MDSLRATKNIINHEPRRSVREPLKSSFSLFMILLSVLAHSTLASNNTFYWIDDSIYVDSGGDVSAYSCNASECIKYACTEAPSTPYCNQCSKIPSNDAYSKNPVDCDSEERCTTCLGRCDDWDTDWFDYLPIPGAYGSNYNYQESHVCTAGKSKGAKCSGDCIPSWHLNCSSESSDNGCSCQAGAYVCVGEEFDISLACDPSVCDPFSEKFESSACACKSGVCQFVPGPVVTRRMGEALKSTRCRGYNTKADPVTLSCSDPKCTASRGMLFCPNCITTATSKASVALAECNRACLLDILCMAVTFDDQSAKNKSSICYKSSGCTTETSSSATLEVHIKESLWKFPKECLPRLQVTEDYYQNPNVGFTHIEPTCQRSTVSVVLNVKFGQLNFGLSDVSLDCVDPGYNPIPDGNPARPGKCQNYAKGFKSSFVQGCPTWPSAIVGRYCSGLDGSILTPAAQGAKISLLPSITERTQVTYPGAKLTGPYQAVRAALRNLTYLPPDDQNTGRLRSRIYSVQSSRALQWPLLKPYEELTMTVIFDDDNCNPNGKKFPRAQVLFYVSICTIPMN
jgi:hypothetical protein